jgi:hypothetical protein
MVLGHARFGQIVLEQTTLINKCTRIFASSRFVIKKNQQILALAKVFQQTASGQNNFHCSAFFPKGTGSSGRYG